MATMPTTNQQWLPYQPTRDCTLGLCSMYCPQWCYIIFPPPPPLNPNPDDTSSSTPTLSPLVIAICAILAVAFLLVSYYTLVSNHCARFNSGRRSRTGPVPPVDRSENRPVQDWPSGAPPDGLDESLIQKISVHRFRRGDGSTVGDAASDCSVCLSEFRDGEAIRLLPKCRHGFHVECIDTWLRSHSNCPLCRACVVVPLIDEVSVTVVAENGGSDSVEQIELGHVVVEIGDEEGNGSSDFVSPRGRVSIADVLQSSEEVDEGKENASSSSSSSSSSASSPSPRRFREQCKERGKSRALHCVMSPVSMKRSVSNGRCSSIKHRS